MALRAVAAAVLVPFGGIAGPAAAGFAEFQRGRAGFAMARHARAVPVLFTAGAGVFGSTVLTIGNIVPIIAGCAGDWFWHSSSGNFYRV